jgi:hypothetical protein
VQVVALSAAAAWALYTFWYQAHYVPAHDRPNVVLSAVLELAGERDGFLVLRARVRAHNPGRVFARLLSESVNLVGTRFPEEKCAPLDPADVPANATSWSLGAGVPDEGAALLASDNLARIPPSARGLEPNEAMERSFVFRVAKHEWASAQLFYEAFYNNSNDRPLRADEFEKRVKPAGVVLAPARGRERADAKYSHTDASAALVLPP